MKILGIGNAIVDVLCKVSDEFLVKNLLTKSTMKLVEETEFKNLLSSIKIEQTISGGSVANSIVGLSQLGNDVGFIGKINNDPLGINYEEGLLKENVSFIYKKQNETLPTGTCVILITPDSERTMCTYLGIAGKINENDINYKSIQKSEITFLEGYLWDDGDPQKALEKAIEASNKVAMSLSDLFCVERHKKKFLDLAERKLDIIFANEQEILSLINSEKIEDAINFAKNTKKNVIITRGSKGAISIYNNEVSECKANTDIKVVDLTGAGDLFAAGYLHAYINNLSLKQCLAKGTEMSSKVISKIGARI
jgi:sugar/nucleoside kinase (ribokinase family)